MNLLLINYEYPPVGGGAANATQFLAQAFTREGHDVQILTAGLRGQEGAEIECGVNVVRLPTRRARADRASMRDVFEFLRQSWLAAPKLQRAARFDATVVFFTIPSGPAALRLHRRFGVPYLISLCGAEVPGHVPGIGWLHALTLPARRAVMRRASAIVANSEGLAATSRRADPFPTEIVPNGVDNSLFHPRGPGAPCDHKALRLIFVGRLHPEKNLATLLMQMKRAIVTGSCEVELQVVGDGAQRSELERLSESLGLSGKIRWLGWRTKAEMPDLYRSADVFILPSLYEGMSNAVLEAMASGLPVIASDVPGNRALVVHDRTGLLFGLADPDRLGEAVVRLAKDQHLRSEMGRAARQRAEADFSWDRTAQRYLELLFPTTLR